MSNSKKPSPTARRRLSIAQRRAELIEIGSNLFSDLPFEEVHIEDIAVKAGISRGLFYHYFDTKRALLHAVVEHEIQALHETTRGDDLRTVIDAYLAYVELRPSGYRMLYSGALADDIAVRTMLADSQRHHEDAILLLLSIKDDQRVVRLAIRSWIAFVVAACLDWLSEKSLERAKLCELCLHVLTEAIIATQKVNQTPQPN